MKTYKKYMGEGELDILLEDYKKPELITSKYLGLFNKKTTIDYDTCVNILAEEGITDFKMTGRNGNRVTIYLESDRRINITPIVPIWHRGFLKSFYALPGAKIYADNVETLEPKDDKTLRVRFY
jgi:hypothetical protein